MSKRLTVGIIGYGYVGKAMAKFLGGHYDIVVYDIVNEKQRFDFSEGPAFRTLTGRSGVDVMRASFNELCDVAVICVPTPQAADGSCDVSAVEQVMSWLRVPRVLLKSTVAVGTTDRLSQQYCVDVVFSPEYCGESSYWTPYAFHTDIKETPFFIFGGKREACSWMVDLIMPVAGPVKQYRITDARTAEVTKYMENTFFYTKIMFCHEIAQICSALGVDYNQARELWLLDPRINPMHTAVFKKEVGEKRVSGKCLPKDLAALISSAEQAGYSPTFLKEVQNANERISALQSE